MAGLPTPETETGVGVGWGPWGDGAVASARDRKGFRAKQEKAKFPFPWFPAWYLQWGEAGWGEASCPPVSGLGPPPPRPCFLPGPSTLQTQTSFLHLPAPLNLSGRLVEIWGSPGGEGARAPIRSRPKVKGAGEPLVVFLEHVGLCLSALMGSGAQKLWQSLNFLTPPCGQLCLSFPERVGKPVLGGLEMAPWGTSWSLEAIGKDVVGGLCRSPAGGEPASHCLWAALGVPFQKRDVGDRGLSIPPP